MFIGGLQFALAKMSRRMFGGMSLNPSLKHFKLLSGSRGQSRTVSIVYASVAVMVGTTCHAVDLRSSVISRLFFR